MRRAVIISYELFLVHKMEVENQILLSYSSFAWV